MEIRLGNHQLGLGGRLRPLAGGRIDDSLVSLASLGQPGPRRQAAAQHVVNLMLLGKAGKLAGNRPGLLVGLVPAVRFGVQLRDAQPGRRGDRVAASSLDYPLEMFEGRRIVVAIEGFGRPEFGRGNQPAVGAFGQQPLKSLARWPPILGRQCNLAAEVKNAVENLSFALARQNVGDHRLRVAATTACEMALGHGNGRVHPIGALAMALVEAEEQLAGSPRLSSLAEQPRQAVEGAGRMIARLGLGDPFVHLDRRRRPAEAFGHPSSTPRRLGPIGRLAPVANDRVQHFPGGFQVADLLECLAAEQPGLEGEFLLERQIQSGRQRLVRFRVVRRVKAAPGQTHQGTAALRRIGLLVEHPLVERRRGFELARLERGLGNLFGRIGRQALSAPVIRIALPGERLVVAAPGIVETAAPGAADRQQGQCLAPAGLVRSLKIRFQRFDRGGESPLAFVGHAEQE